jgi:putative ABC transport system ATP-binding protein
MASQGAGSAGTQDTVGVAAVLPDVPAEKRVFTVRDVRKVYTMGDVEVHALRSIDLDVRESELVTLLGASGSGKSTLLNILGGLDVPSGGSVLFRNLDLAAASDETRTTYRRESVGFVFQFYNLIPSLTARENVALVTDIAVDPMPPEEALDRAGLGHRLDHFPSQLSGGEQQRVAIARAIAKRPAVLLCDEPTGALDYETGKVVLDAIARINQELGTTTVIITHNAAIADVGDRVIRLSSGRITEAWANARRASAAEIQW